GRLRKYCYAALQRARKYWNRFYRLRRISFRDGKVAARRMPSRRHVQSERSSLSRTSSASEEAKLLRAVADQQILGLLIVVEHHLMGLATDARLLVAAERRVRGIGVIAIGPDAAGLDRAAEAVAAIGVAAPDAGAEAVQRVVGDRQGFVIGLEGRDRYDRAKDLLLEDPHLVVPLEHGRLNIEAAGKITGQRGAAAAGEQLGTFLLSNVDIGKNFLQLLVRRLGADHGGGVARVALHD